MDEFTKALDKACESSYSIIVEAVNLASRVGLSSVSELVMAYPYIVYQKPFLFYNLEIMLFEEGWLPEDEFLGLVEEDHKKYSRRTKDLKWADNLQGASRAFARRSLAWNMEVLLNALPYILNNDKVAADLWVSVLQERMAKHEPFSAAWIKSRRELREHHNLRRKVWGA